MLTRAEALLASAITALASAILFAYIPYQAGWRVWPSAVLLLATAATALCGRALIRRSRPSGDGWTVVIPIAFMGAIFLWIARPDLLPVGGGPDLTHHLVLINYIERTWRLVDDPALYPYLGDMMDYTPGSHLLIALTGAWLGVPALRVIHPVLVLTVALKSGVIVCIARRTIVEPSGRHAFAMASAIILLVPYQYFAGSFLIHSYWAHLVSELFACAAWWAVLVWRDEHQVGAVGLFALFGAAVFVTWPIWTGPLLIFAAAVILLDRRDGMRARLLTLAAAIVPVILIAVIHSAARLGRLQMAGTTGATLQPSVDVLGTPFVALAALGALPSVASSRARHVVWFAAAIALQAAGLWLAARIRGAEAPYLALKMMYLAIYPMAISAVAGLAFAWNSLSPLAMRPRLAMIVAGAICALAVERTTTAPTSKPIVSLSTWRAGLWARAHVDRACVDYLVADGYTGYWLHLAVLDNPRDTPRFMDPDTFEPQKAVARWIDVAGLPYAIVDDVDGFSHALFNGTDTLAQFDRSRVLRRRGPSRCQ